MKVIATIPKSHYNQPNYIVELSTDEIVALNFFKSYYESVTVTDSNGNICEREFQKLEVGDVIPEAVSQELKQNVIDFNDAREVIGSSMSSLRSSLTKFENVFKSKGVKS